MDKPDIDPRRSAEALYADIDSYIMKASERLLAGEFVQLGDLNHSVDVLCQRVLNLRADEAQYFIPKLETLRLKLDALQAAMLDAKTQVADDISDTDKRQKAAQAYRPPEDKK